MAPMSADSKVCLRKVGGVAHLQLSRTERANAVDLPTASAFAAAVSDVAADESVRAVLLTAAGRTFCAGGDVAAMASPKDSAAYLHELATTFDEALVALDALDVPVVAAVQGAVAGAGLGLALCADVVIAEPATRFIAAYSAVGLTPDCGVSWLLPRAVGQGRALELLITGRVLDAAEAYAWGLVTALDADPATRAGALANQMAAGPGRALGTTRALVRSSWAHERRAAGERETAAITAALTHPDATALVRRFAGSADS
jgi:2-(1,2-epoxy-1,2-dihydrophenyl)acetyl-CoA isomerase